MLIRKSTYLVRRVTGQPQPEVGVHVGHVERIAYRLQRSHPRRRKMTVLQADPVARIPRLLDQQLGFGTLIGKRTAIISRRYLRIFIYLLTCI